LSSHFAHRREILQKKYSRYLTIAALGIVYGDIGTSPLYAVRENFVGVHSLPTTITNVLGVISLILWSLILVVTVKYASFVMRADNRGEGGILALMALVTHSNSEISAKMKRRLIMLGLLGTALMYGDGVITPAISVLSAVEGLDYVTPAFSDYIVIITICILTLLFIMQRYGTGSIGRLFGPIMLAWFLTLSVTGIYGLLKAPHVLHSLNPLLALRFLFSEGTHSFVTLGSVFLAVTGAEALYADMGHFGNTPIRRGWYWVVFPSLSLNYLGQGALLISSPKEIRNPFFQLVPSELALPLVVIATIATIIASQALISGAFSLTRQAIQLGYLPRQEIRHTSSREIGQIYIPQVNFFLWIAAIALVLHFRNSSGLAGAYGISVSMTMVITTLLLYMTARHVWKWRKSVSLLLLVSFLVVDLAFFFSNSMKLFMGGWIAIAIAMALFTIMSTWASGREILRKHLLSKTRPLEGFINEVEKLGIAKVNGTALYMTGTALTAPMPLVHNVRHNHVIHERLALLTVRTEEIPFVPRGDRVTIGIIGEGIYQVVVRYGFMESPNVPQALASHAERLQIDPDTTTYFMGRETLVSSKNQEFFKHLREKLFTFLSNNALRATNFYQIPLSQVMEIGVQVELSAPE
jgi:KUP system potassium uptake protein